MFFKNTSAPCFRAARIALTLLSAAASPACTAGVDDEIVDDVEEVDDNEEEAVGQAQLAFGETACKDIAPVATFTGAVTGTYTSPETYAAPGCIKSIAVQINDYDPDYVGADWSHYGGTFVTWNGDGLTTPEACTAAVVKADLYRWKAVFSGGMFGHYEWVRVARRSSNGQMIGNWCSPPAVGFANRDDQDIHLPGVNPDILLPGHDYKLVMTARSSSSGPTQALSVYSQRDGVIE